MSCHQEFSFHALKGDIECKALPAMELDNLTRKYMSLEIYWFEQKSPRQNTGLLRLVRNAFEENIILYFHLYRLCEAFKITKIWKTNEEIMEINWLGLSS